ncbi:hypothetical protein QWJ07_31415 [Frankia sp. RB7]|nr:hypothetical protein [Frankia sp. RB7]
MRPRSEIEAELKQLEAANEAATSWGAAVGARHERIKGLKAELAREQLIACQRPEGER